MRLDSDGALHPALVISINVAGRVLPEGCAHLAGSKAMKTILVPLVGMASDKIALAAGLAVVRRFSGHMDVLHVRADPVKIAMQTIGYDTTGSNLITPELVTSLQQAADEVAARARKAFEDFATESAIAIAERPDTSDQASACYREVQGDRADVVARARVHEMTVMARADALSGLGANGVGDILVRSGRPVLLAAGSATGAIGINIAIAWKDTAEASRAVLAALPLIAKAERVEILVAAEDGINEAAASADRLAGELAWHGVTANVRCVAPVPDAPSAVLDAARAAGADLMIMGAYSHSRAREFVFGGFTRSMLDSAPMPILLAH